MKFFRKLALVLMLFAPSAFAAQTVILPDAVTAATSSDVTNLSTGTLTAYVVGGAFPPVALPVFAVANGNESQVGYLDGTHLTFQMTGPGVVYRVKRPRIDFQAATVGVASDLAPAASGGAVTCASCALETGGHLAAIDTTAGALGDAACATDNGSCSLAALIKRLNQRLTTLNTTLGSPLQAGATQPVSLAALPALATGTNSIGSVAAASSGGWSLAYSANVTNTAVAVDASAGQIGWYAIGNGNSSVCYLQLYNVAQGSVTVGTTQPTYSIMVPAFGGANSAAGLGLAFATAISAAATTTRAGSTACAAGLDVNIGGK